MAGAILAAVEPGFPPLRRAKAPQRRDGGQPGGIGVHSDCPGPNRNVDLSFGRLEAARYGRQDACRYSRCKPEPEL